MFASSVEVKEQELSFKEQLCWYRPRTLSEQEKTFFYYLFTKGTGIHCRYEVPREEPREAHGYLALGYDS